MSISQDSESGSRNHWQYCIRFSLYFVLFFLPISLQRRKRSSPFYANPIDNPHCSTSQVRGPVFIRVTQQGGWTVYRSAKKSWLCGCLSPGMPLVYLRHTLPHHCAPSQPYRNSSRCRSRVDLKGCDYLYTRIPFYGFL